jgi:DNA-binding LytR/AlgR family response regulator
MKTILTTNIHIGGRKEVCPEEIILLVADINYTQVFFSNGSKAIVATTLKELERRFRANPLFFRTHKSFLINLNFVANHESLAENYIKMSNEKKVIVSRRKKLALQMKIFNLV